MEPTDLTIEILKSIRDEVKQTNVRLETMGCELGGRIDETNVRIETMGHELGRRIVESELRTSTALTELAGSVRDLTTLLRVQGELRPRVEKCEHDIAELQHRAAHA